MSELTPRNTDEQYNALVVSIGQALEDGRKYAARSVNNILIATYWQIGQYIVDYEQGGQVKAEYGTELLKRLSDDLTSRFGKGFSHSNIVYIRKLYLAYPKSQTLSDKLTSISFESLLFLKLLCAKNLDRFTSEGGGSFSSIMVNILCYLATSCVHLTETGQNLIGACVEMLRDEITQAFYEGLSFL